ncbi:MAG TPA: SMC-Scp complex subunit ScpB [Blastocatellia bacterium]|nr:SMC-Scp complex subunit ScpB [Blastocatellia bacterium]
MRKNRAEQVEASANEYSEIFAKLAADEEAENGASEEAAVETIQEEVTVENIEFIEAVDVDRTNSDDATSEISNLQPEMDDVEITASLAELKPAIEAILFVADEPVPFNQLCKILGDVNSADVYATIVELMSEYEARNSGLELREIAGGWRISTRPQHHEFIRKYLKSKPSARLSLPALETLAVIAYKQPVTVPEVLEIRGVSSSSAIKTLLEKRLIVTKGRKETVGRPMMYGTSKEFLIQFGLRDLNELPSIEDFEELAA